MEKKKNNNSNDFDNMDIKGKELGLLAMNGILKLIHVEKKINGDFKGILGFFREKKSEHGLIKHYKRYLKYNLKCLEEEQRAERESAQKN